MTETEPEIEKIVRYGIVGCGTRAYRRHYLPGLEIPDLKLVALCDPAHHYPGDFTNDSGEGVTLYPTFEEMLASPEVDAVVICTPGPLHARMLDAAIVAGKHVMVDKPAAVTTADLLQLRFVLERARAAGLVVSSCHPRRYNAAHLALRDGLRRWTQTFGQALHLDLDFSGTRPSKSDPRSSLLADRLSHEFDYMNFVFGKSDCMATRLYDGADRYEVAGVRDDGLTFHFSGTHRLLRREGVREVSSETVRIRFERCDILLDAGPGFITASYHDMSDAPEGGRHVRRPSDGTSYPHALMRVMLNFSEAILYGKDPYLTHDDILINSLICVELTGNQHCRITFPK